MKILFADTLPKTFIDCLRERGDDCIVRPDLNGNDLPSAIGDADVLVVRSTEVTAKTIDQARHLGLVVRSGAGTNTIDCQAAADAGVYVCNVPGTNSVAVAELTIGLLLAIDRHIADATSDLRNSIWNKEAYNRADGLLGRTIGIIGVGEIGLAVAERARCFGMSVVAIRNANRHPDTEARIRSIGIRLVEHLDGLLEESDIVSIHVPSGNGTVGLVDAAFLDKMQTGAILLNTSRGEVVDEVALLKAIREKGIRAGLDVFCGEPDQGTAAFSSELAANPNVVGTHHIGASTQQAQDATSAGTIDVIEAYRSGDLLNCVNVVHTRLGTSTITIRHYDRVGVLAAVFEELRKSEINVQTMQNKVFEGEMAAVAVIDVSGEVPQELTDRLSCLEHVIRVRVTHHDR